MSILLSLLFLLLLKILKFVSQITIYYNIIHCHDLKCYNRTQYGTASS